MSSKEIQEMLLNMPEEIVMDEELKAALRYYEHNEDVVFIKELKEGKELCF